MRAKILVQKGYWTTMLESAKYNKWNNYKIADEIIKGIEEALNIQNVSKPFIKHCTMCEKDIEHRIIHACLECDRYL